MTARVYSLINIKKAGSLILKSGFRLFARRFFANAVPTAEGAVAIAINKLSSTLFGSVCVVTGFGRIAKVLTKLLTAFGAKVYVAARKPADLAWAKIYGASAVKIEKLPKILTAADVVFNTVPAVLLDKSALLGIRPGALIIDLASKPGESTLTPPDSFL